MHILEKKKKPSRGIQEFTTKVSAFPLVILKQKKKRTGHTQEQKRIYKVELSTLLKKYRVNGETFYHHAGRYANQPVEKRKLVQEILEMGAELEEIVQKGHRLNSKITVGDDPKKLVEDVIALVKKYKIAEYKITKIPVSNTQ